MNQKTVWMYAVLAAVIIVSIVLLIIAVDRHRKLMGDTGQAMRSMRDAIRQTRAIENPSNPQEYEYSGYLDTSKAHRGKDAMSVGAHWDTDGTYGHTAATLPSFGLSGYYGDVPTDSYS